MGELDNEVMEADAAEVSTCRVLHANCVRDNDPGRDAGRSAMEAPHGVRMRDSAGTMGTGIL